MPRLLGSLLSFRKLPPKRQLSLLQPERAGKKAKGRRAESAERVRAKEKEKASKPVQQKEQILRLGAAAAGRYRPLCLEPAPNFRLHNAEQARHQPPPLLQPHSSSPAYCLLLSPTSCPCPSRLLASPSELHLEESLGGIPHRRGLLILPRRLSRRLRRQRRRRINGQIISPPLRPMSPAVLALGLPPGKEEVRLRLEEVDSNSNSNWELGAERQFVFVREHPRRPVEQWYL